MPFYAFEEHPIFGVVRFEFFWVISFWLVHPALRQFLLPILPFPFRLLIVSVLALVRNRIGPSQFRGHPPPLDSFCWASIWQKLINYWLKLCKPKMERRICCHHWHSSRLPDYSMWHPMFGAIHRRDEKVWWNCAKAMGKDGQNGQSPLWLLPYCCVP